MLKPAVMYKDEVNNKINETWFKDKYKYYYSGGSFYKCDISDDSEGITQFVSVNSDNEVIGLIQYHIDRWCYNAHTLGIICFSGIDKYKFTFAKDIEQAMTDIFSKFNYNKLSFWVIVGNPAEESYDRLVQKFNGRIVGVQKNETKIMSGELCDVKLYEITKDEYDLRGRHRFHSLKILPEYFNNVVSGDKRFELRKNDRNYKVGDIVELKEWNPNKEDYTGGVYKIVIKYILKDCPQYGLKENYVIFGW